VISFSRGIELFAFAFLVGSTLALWYLFIYAVLNGDTATVYTNLSGERNIELLLCAGGMVASAWTIPKVMFRGFLP
jgi:hypothetical protein